MKITARMVVALLLANAVWTPEAGAASPTVVGKTTDQIYNSSSTTLQSDNDLKLHLSGNGTDIWFVEYYLFVNTADTNMDFKTALDVGATGATGDLWFLNIAQTTFPNFGFLSGSNPINPGGLTTPLVVGSTNGLWGLSIAARIFDNGTAGDVVLQCAQNTSTAGAIALKKGSFMRATRVQDMIWKTGDQNYNATKTSDTNLILTLPGNGTDIWFDEYYLFINATAAGATFSTDVLFSGSKKADHWLLNTQGASGAGFGAQLTGASPVLAAGPGGAFSPKCATGLFGSSSGVRVFDAYSGSATLECQLSSGSATLQKGSFIRTTGRTTPNCAFKTSDQTYTSSSTTLQNDNDLTFALAGNKGDVWFVEYYLFINTADTNMDFKAGLSVPAGATGDLWYLNTGAPGFPNFAPQVTTVSPLSPGDLTTVITAGSAACTTTVQGWNLANAWGLSFAARIFDGGTAGNVVLQCAQNTSDAGAITLQKGSFLRATKVVHGINAGTTLIMR